MELHLVVAMSENRVIGRDGALPWAPFGDLKRVRRLTMGHPIVMGRRTHESIGRVLPGRPNVILSRRPGYAIPDAHVFPTLEAALAWLRPHFGLAFVFGGADVYRQALPFVQRIHLTLIHAEFEGDTFFPELPPGTFVEVERETHETPGRFSWIVLERADQGARPQ